MKLILIALAAFVALASAAPLSEEENQFLFVAWAKEHDKVYTHDEFFTRYTVFKKNLETVRAHNAGKHSYTLAMNKFGDMTTEEFKAKMTGYKRIDMGLLRAKNAVRINTSAVPNAVDWRAKGAVTGVKDQGQCGSCWSFSATGSMEGAWFIAGNQLASLSEQQLVDCSTAQGNQGCNGGLMDYAFQYVIANGGITSEANYPYTATGPNTCQTKPSVASISKFVDVNPMDEKALEAAVNIGPVSVAIEADQSCFQFYSSGILNDPSCGTQLDHGVLTVGYGTDAGQAYWIVKNSWGASWGDHGYIKIAKGTGGAGICGIASEPSYPLA